MKGKQNQETARRIVKYYNEHQEDRSTTTKHFQDEGIPLRTIQNVLKRYIDDGRVDYSWNSGPARSVLTKTNLKKIRGKFISKPSIIGRKVAKEVGISEKSVRRAKGELGIITRKKITAPKYVGDQRERCKKNAWKLYKRLRCKLVVMDDETYALPQIRVKFLAIIIIMKHETSHSIHNKKPSRRRNFSRNIWSGKLSPQTEPSQNRSSRPAR